MAFKYQKLTKEDADYINSFKIPYPYSGGNVLLEFDNDDWTPIDRERNIYYVYAGGLGELSIEHCPPMVNYLIMEDALIRFDSYYSRKKNKKTNKNHYIYQIEGIRAPLMFEGKDMDKRITDAIKAALEEYERGSSKYYESIEFSEIAEPWYTDLDPRA